MIFRQPVKQVMRKNSVLDIQDSDSIVKAIQRMDQADISALPVRSQLGSYCGVISKSDIASLRMLNALKSKGSVERILVRDMMNRTPPLYVMENDPIQEAISQMHRRHIHRLFVADPDYQLVGVVSMSDILRMLLVS